MSVPTDRKYAESHEWYLPEGELLIVGITQFAADELTDITYVELPPAGTELQPSEPCGGIESVKAYSEVYCAVPGQVVEVNAALEENPGLINEDAFDKGWMMKIKPSGPLDGLLEAADYEKQISS